MFCKPDSRSYGLRRYTDYIHPSIPSSEGTFCRTPCVLRVKPAGKWGLSSFGAWIRHPHGLHPERPQLRLTPLYRLYPPLNPLLGGDFLSHAMRAPGEARGRSANNSIASRMQFTFYPGGLGCVYMQPERSANSPLRRLRARYFRQSGRIDRWRATADGDNAGVEKRHRHCRCGTKNAIFVL